MEGAGLHVAAGLLLRVRLQHGIPVATYAVLSRAQAHVHGLCLVCKVKGLGQLGCIAAKSSLATSDALVQEQPYLAIAAGAR
eukprot:366020-Chlamydomonas_euryale.AAC.1